VFAYILGLKDTSFIAGYSGVELDPALLRGEIDLRSNGADTIVQRNKDWLKGGVVNFHAITETPKGEKHPAFPNLPEIETFAKSPLDRKIITMQRAFRVTGTPFVLPPATPKDRVEILQDAFRKTYKDPEFAKHYQKLTTDEPSPLLPEDHEKAIRDVPRDREAVEVFKRLANAVALPPRR
jgi:tripartite-type tricarboxylate transporter receptor subunit TctC